MFELLVIERAYFDNTIPFMPTLSGLDILLALPMPCGLGYVILALQAIYEATLD